MDTGSRLCAGSGNPVVTARAGRFLAAGRHPRRVGAGVAGVGRIGLSAGAAQTLRQCASEDRTDLHAGAGRHAHQPAHGVCAHVHLAPRPGSALCTCRLLHAGGAGLRQLRRPLYDRRPGSTGGRGGEGGCRRPHRASAGTLRRRGGDAGRHLQPHGSPVGRGGATRARGRRSETHPHLRYFARSRARPSPLC